MESTATNEEITTTVRQDMGQANNNKWRQLKQSISLLSNISKKDSKFRNGTSAWKALKEAMLKRKGLVEIGPRHANHEFTQIVMKSLRNHFSTTNNGSDDKKHVTEFHHSCCQCQVEIDLKNLKQSRVAEKIKTIDPNNSITTLPKRNVRSITFTSYAPETFESFRECLGITNESYLNSLSPDDDYQPYLQYIANSKSSALFFFTHDRRFIIKTEERKNLAKFMEFLRKYIDHFETSPHSLLVKILGAYSIRHSYPRRKTKFFIIMQSIFWPSSGINERFDLKGCTGGRKEDELELSKFNEFVMKDGNFSGKHLYLGSERSWFIEQLSRDVKFLKGLNLMDYSLLIGIQAMNGSNSNYTERGINTPTFADLVFRVKRSSSALSKRNSMTTEDGIEKVISKNQYREAQKEFNEVEHKKVPINNFSTPPGHDIKLDMNNRRKSLFQQESEDNYLYKNKRRHSQIEVRFKRNSVSSYDHNTYEVHHPPTKEELKNNALIMADIPAPPPSSLSVISPPNSSESSSNKIATQAASTLNSSSAQHNKYRRLEIHKNISAVVKQLSVYANKKKTNDIVPLETLPRLRTVSSQIDNKYLDLIDKKVDNVAFNNFNVNANIQTTTSSHYLHQSTKRPSESKHSSDLYQEPTILCSNNNDKTPHIEASNSPIETKYPREKIKRLANGEAHYPKYDTGLYKIETVAECKDSNIPDDGKSISHMKLPSEGSILNVENRRLLPNSANGTHILEGPQNRYYIGIIDIFTEYGVRQKVGRVLKTMKFFNCNHSSVPPERYASRFVSFIQRRLD